MLSPYVAQTRMYWTYDVQCTIYHSLAQKSTHWAEQLTSLPKRRVGTLLSVSTFNLRKSAHVVFTATRCPRSNRTRQIIVYNRITSSFEVESWQHTTLRTVPCHRECAVARGAHCISYVRLSTHRSEWALLCKTMVIHIIIHVCLCVSTI